MTLEAVLVLAGGAVFRGKSIGSVAGTSGGEVVFNMLIERGVDTAFGYSGGAAREIKSLRSSETHEATYFNRSQD